MDAVFPSASSEHLEPVLNFRVVHEDNAHLHTLENLLDPHHPAKKNAANSLAAHSQVLRQRNGHKQPHPDTISVKFRAFDREFYFPHLQLDAHTWAPYAKHEFVDEHGVRSEHQMTLNTYRGTFDGLLPGNGDTADEEGVYGWVVVTLAADGLMTATIHTNRETWQVDPLFVHHHELDQSSKNFQSLRKAAVHGMVMHAHSAQKHRGKDPLTGQFKNTCKVAKPQGVTHPEPGTTGYQTPEMLNPEAPIQLLEEGGDPVPSAMQLHPVGPNAATTVLKDAGDVSAARRRLLLDPGVGVTREKTDYA